jgi:hypothetical protein
MSQSPPQLYPFVRFACRRSFKRRGANRDEAACLLYGNRAIRLMAHQPPALSPLQFLNVLVLLLAASACRVPAGMNNDCDWPSNAPKRTLVENVRTAEELAIRYADGRYDSKGAHGRFRSECEAKLFTLLANAHQVSVTDVSAAREQLARNSFDAPVHVPLVAFYLAAVLLASRRIRHRFPSDEGVAITVTSVFVGVGIGVVMVVLGHLWDGIIEMLRVGNTHMSYRAERLGFREHTAKVFGVALVLFWCAVLAAYYAPPRR